MTDQLETTLSAAREGGVDPEALAAAVRPELLRLTRTYMRDHALAEDVAHEALLEVLSTVAALRNPSSARAWLRLLVRKHADRATRRVRPVLSLDFAVATADPADGPEALVARRSDVAVVRRGLAVVADADALLLRLRYLGEWTDAELGELVGASGGAVRKRLHDARRRLRAAVLSNPPDPSRKERPMSNFDEFVGSVVAPGGVPEPPKIVLAPTSKRLETGLKILDAVLPVEAGGSVDLLGPTGLGQLVLVVEIAKNTGATIVACGPSFADLLDDELQVPAVVVDDTAQGGGEGAVRLARGLASAGHQVLLVLDPALWGDGPETGTTAAGGSVTAFRFAVHPRGGPATAPCGAAGTQLVFSTASFVVGRYPAIDVTASQSQLIDDDVLDGVTVGVARATREAVRRGEEVREFLAQALSVGEPYTGQPGERVAARDATAALAALVR